MGAQNARNKQKAAHDVSTNVPSAVQQRMVEIPRSLYDWWRDLD